MRMLGWALLQYDYCPYKEKEFGHTEGHLLSDNCDGSDVRGDRR